MLRVDSKSRPRGLVRPRGPDRPNPDLQHSRSDALCSSIAPPHPDDQERSTDQRKRVGFGNGCRGDRPVERDFAKTRMLVGNRMQRPHVQQHELRRCIGDVVDPPHSVESQWDIEDAQRCQI